MRTGRKQFESSTESSQTISSAPWHPPMSQRHSKGRASVALLILSWITLSGRFRETTMLAALRCLTNANGVQTVRKINESFQRILSSPWHPPMSQRHPRNRFGCSVECLMDDPPFGKSSVRQSCPSVLPVLLTFRQPSPRRPMD